MRSILRCGTLLLALAAAKGTIAMARTEEPNSATNQWFFNTKDKPIYNGNYTVFGQVTAGIEVLDLLAGLGVYATNLDVYTSPTTFQSESFGEVPIAFAGTTPLLVTATSPASSSADGRGCPCPESRRC